MVVSLVVGAWAALHGQTVRGRLLEVDTLVPISGGFVALLAETGAPVATTLSDRDGAFAFSAQSPGRYRLQARRLGYRMRVYGPFELGPGEQLEVFLHLVAAAERVDSVTVTAERRVRFLEVVGFYERQRSAFGHFITRAVIEKVRRNRLTDVLRTVPGVRLVPLGTGTGRVAVRMRGSDLADIGLCEPRVFVDGLVVIPGDARPPKRPAGVTPEGVIDDPYAEGPPNLRQDVDQLVDPNDVEAIEVYRSAAEVPVAFGGSGMFTRCGVIVVWTRRGGAR